MIQGGWNPGTRRVLTNNPYVTDGLVTMWDGIWNVGNGSKRHDPSLHVWRDQVGGGIPIVSSNLYSYFVDDGFLYDIDNIKTPLVGGPVGASDSEYSWKFCEVIFTLNKFSNTNAALVFGCGSRASITLQKSTSSIGMTTVSGKTYTFPNLDFSSLPVKIGVSVSYSGTSSSDVNGQTMWLNGVSNGTLDGASDSWGNIKLYTNMIGNTYSGIAAYVAGVTYHSIRLYSRVLTQDEITANHGVDAERFNLGGGSEWPILSSRPFSHSSRGHFSRWRKAA